MTAALVDQKGRHLETKMYPEDLPCHGISGDQLKTDAPVTKKKNDLSFGKKRFRGNPTENGLFSKSSISVKIDNRYHCRDTVEEVSDKTLKAGLNFCQSVVPDKSPNSSARHKSLNDKRRELNPVGGSRSDFDMDNEFDKGMSKNIPRRYPERNHSYKLRDQKEKGEQGIRPQDLPPYSQFYAENIKYPTASAGNTYKQQGQTSSFVQSDKHTGGKHEGYSEKTQSRFPHMKEMQKQDTRPKESASHTFPYDDFPVDLFYDQEDEVDDFEDVPAYSDIPLALLMAQSVDGKTLRRAKRKEEQLFALKMLTGLSRKKRTPEKINKNKNRRLKVSKDGDSIEDTYKEELLVNKEQESTETILNNLKSQSQNLEVKAQNRQVHSATEWPSCRKKKSYSQISDLTSRDKNVNFLDKEKLLDTESLASVENEVKDGLVDNVRISEDSGKNKRSQSPVDDSNRITELHPSKDTTVNEHLTEIKKDNVAQQACQDNQSPTVEETGSFVREKRLEKLTAKAIYEKHVASGAVPKRKPDNRDVAFHIDNVHKHVKPKAFRSKVPNFSNGSSHEQTMTDSHDVKEHGSDVTKISEPEKPKLDPICLSDEKLSQINSNPGSTNQRQITTKHLTEKTENDDSTDKEKAKQVTQTKISKLDEHADLKKSFKKSDILECKTEIDPSNSHAVIPLVMKLQRNRKHYEQRKQTSDINRLQSTDYSDEEDSVEPVAMRMLREVKAKRNVMKGAYPESSSGSGYFPFPFSFLSSALGVDSDERTAPEDTKPARKQITGTNSRPKNKNKNVIPTKKKATDQSITETEDTEGKRDKGDADDVVKPADSVQEGKERQILLLRKTKEGYTGHILKFTSKPDTKITVAENRHRAFKKLKTAVSEDSVKCNSCGRPDCKGYHIQKMKEIIKMAKQASFEVRDVTPDGNCMFAAVVDQLHMYGDYRFGPKSLREAAVSWLIDHPNSADGTHYSSFLSEDWDVYLRRMIAEGEWGDHVILRAVVEVIGHTIKVLSVRGEESHWTILEPESIDATKDGMHLVLGHVGEFHYTSLRPADGNSSLVPASPQSLERQDSVVTNGEGQVALEGTETVEMFREDYIDTLSDMPMVHFSYLLKNVIPIKVVNTASIVSSRFVDNMAKFNLNLFISGNEVHTTWECTGRRAEGVYVPCLQVTVDEYSTFEYENDLTTFGIVNDFRVVDKNSEEAQTRTSEFLLDTAGVHVGFCKLLRTGAFAEEQYTMYQQHLHLNYEGKFPDVRKVVALRCPFWPECAQSWKSRPRREGFPTADIVASVASEGCLLVPNCHKRSKFPDIEWQFSFSLCEKKLFKEAVTVHQKYCYILLDALCIQTMSHLECISPAHLKSVFFYACERIPADYWQSSPGACILYMLDELLRYVRNKNLPNYFVHANNMIDHLQENDFKEIEEQIILLRSQPVVFLRQIDEILKMLPIGSRLIDKVFDDIPKFKTHRSVKRSTLEVFVPTTIELAHEHIKKRKFAEGYEILSEAFQDRLSVSTCDDSVPFQVFFPGAVSGLDLDSLVWFSAYTDKQLEGQMSKSLVRETCGDLTLMKINEILPADKAGSYGNTEVPVGFSRRLCSFCYDFAKFLYNANKLSDILPILYHCHDIFEKKMENSNCHQENETNKEQPEIDDFNDGPMFNIYTAMFHVYRRQMQLKDFRAIVPTLDALVGRIHTRWAYDCLSYVYECLEDFDNADRTKGIFHQLPSDHDDGIHFNEFNSWLGIY